MRWCETHDLAGCIIPYRSPLVRHEYAAHASVTLKRRLIQPTGSRGVLLGRIKLVDSETHIFRANGNLEASMSNIFVADSVYSGSYWESVRKDEYRGLLESIQLSQAQ